MKKLGLCSVVVSIAASSCAPAPATGITSARVSNLERQVPHRGLNHEMPIIVGAGDVICVKASADPQVISSFPRNGYPSVGEDLSGIISAAMQSISLRMAQSAVPMTDDEGVYRLRSASEGGVATLKCREDSNALWITITVSENRYGRPYRVQVELDQGNVHQLVSLEREGSPFHPSQSAAAEGSGMIPMITSSERWSMAGDISALTDQLVSLVEWSAEP